MSNVGTKALAAGIGLALAAGLALLALQLRARRPGGGTVELRDQGAEFERLRAGGALRDLPKLGVGKLPRRLLPPETAGVVFPIQGPYLVYDPLPYFRRRAFLRVKQSWPEHPQGSWVMATNSLGMREDRDVPAAQAHLRVLLTGDSHMDGVCMNAEALPNVAESVLRHQHPDKRIEVWNAACGGFSFYNYVGTLERLHELEPQVFVVVVYGGNDFYEMLAPWHFFRATKLRHFGRESRERVETVKDLCIGAPSQGYVSLIYFEEFPEQAEIAVGASLLAMEEMAEICAQREIHLLCLYLPPLLDVQPLVVEPELERVDRDARVSPEAHAGIDRMADRFLAGLAERGIDACDLRPRFRESEEQLYWRADHHLGLAGHRLGGEILAERLAPFVR